MEVLEKVDVLVTPTLPVVPPRIAEKELKIGRRKEPVRSILLRFTRPGNLTGLPAISLPCGFTPDRIPIGMQIFARRFDEPTLLRVAQAYEQATSWHEISPSEINLSKGK
jgi:aspartyl-tRNA(Asn)/glutamyl-tRNA(Gln) amidotransferase subunit A